MKNYEAIKKIMGKHCGIAFTNWKQSIVCSLQKNRPEEKNNHKVFCEKISPRI